MKNNKKYLISIKHKNGAVLSIGAYCDIINDKFFRIYYEGRDTGRRYSFLGNAARYLEKTADQWIGCTKTTGTINDIPATGSRFNIDFYKFERAGGPFPDYTKYIF